MEINIVKEGEARSGRGEKKIDAEISVLAYAMFGFRQIFFLLPTDVDIEPYFLSFPRSPLTFLSYEPGRIESVTTGRGISLSKTSPFLFHHRDDMSLVRQAASRVLSRSLQGSRGRSVTSRVQRPKIKQQTKASPTNKV